jgi:hypothetical protein
LKSRWTRSDAGDACGSRRVGAVAPAAVDALEAVVAHQAGDAFAADMDVQAEPELGVDARRPVGPRLRAWTWRICSPSSASA